MSTKTNLNILVDKILELKAKKDVVILAHNYQIPQIQEVADFLGDSLELAKKSSQVEKGTIIFCGVLFMAETAKILSPQKKVLIPNREAGCPLADMITPEQLLKMKEKYPQAAVVTYVNSPAEVKALSDTCCTSANAINIVKNIPAKQIIFTPDKNLAWWVQRNVPEKEIIPWQGFCYVHQQFTLEDLKQARKKYPQAKILLHPECLPELLKEADEVLSTSGMLRYAKESPYEEFIIATEEGLIHRLKKENPKKKFYSLGALRTCVNMKKITLPDLYRSLLEDIYPINLSKEVIEGARKSLERMVQYT